MRILPFTSNIVLKIRKGVVAILLSVAGLSQLILPVQGGHVTEAVTSSSLDANWPGAPAVSSETAILIEAETGTILYEKDSHKQMYPASITKTLTTLIAYEMCELDESVVFSQEALDTIPADSSRIWVDIDNYMSMESCLEAILIMSANDVAAGVAEHIAGNLDGFADIMNERAKELGCLNSHFVNAHGYHDPDHYTTAYDMAQIGRAFFEIDLLCTLAKERTFSHGPTEGQPKEIKERNSNQLLATREYEYEYLVGSKTGYTDQAGQTLISCAQKDGLKLICVVMNAKRPDQYKDTIALFDFGFSNFTTANIYDNDKTYVSADSSYGMEVTDVLGDSSALLNMDRSSIVVLPKTADFADVTSYITMATEDEKCMATAHYQYGTHNIGSAQIYVTALSGSLQDNTGALEQTKEPIHVTQEEPTPIYVNIKKLALFVIPSVLIFFILIWGVRQVTAYHQGISFSNNKRRGRRRFSGLRRLFIGFFQGIQAIGNYFGNLIKSVAMRTRYKKRSYSRSVSNNRRTGNIQVDFDLKAGRQTSKDYYNSADLKRKNIVFHDLKK